MRKVSSLLISLFIIISTIAHFPATQLSYAEMTEECTNANTNWMNKINSTLYETADRKGDKYLVTLHLEEISSDIINKNVLQKTGYDVSVYESEAFYTEVVPRIKEDVKTQNSVIAQHASQTNVSLDDMRIVTEEEAIQEEMNKYIMAKRSVLREMNTQNNDLFLENYNINTSEIIYKSRYSSWIMLYLTQSEIQELAQSPQVCYITPSQQTTAQDEQYAVMPQIKVEDETGTKSSSYNNGLGYSGAGVKIGIIEYGYTCDVTHVQLTKAYNENRLIIVDNIREDGTVVPSTVDDHATVVTAMLVGSEIVVDGKKYCGVVPDATAYITSVIYRSDLYSAIEMLADAGVSVINCSLGFGGGTDYTDVDQKVDDLIQKLNITFVKSAGNSSSNITSPGKAYNVITVGNALTKTIYYTLSQPYQINPSSSYVNNIFITNKPDIVAPGTHVTIANDANGHTGTSFSAPLVTGVVAQLHQANPALKSDTVTTKAILLAGANPNSVKKGCICTNTTCCVNTECDSNSCYDESCTYSGCGNNITDNEYFREKSGAGFVDAIGAVSISTSGNTDRVYFNLNQSTPHDFYDIFVTLPANSTIRVAMTFNKPENIKLTEAYGNNVTMGLYASDYTLLDCVYSNNNVDIIEYTATESGTYLISLLLEPFIQADTATALEVGVAWSITTAT